MLQQSGPDYLRTMDGGVYGFGSSQHGELGCGVSMGVHYPLRMEYNALHDPADPVQTEEGRRTAIGPSAPEKKRDAFGTWGGGMGSSKGPMPPALSARAFASQNTSPKSYSPYSSPTGSSGSRSQRSSPYGSPGSPGSAPGPQPRFGSW